MVSIPASKTHTALVSGLVVNTWQHLACSYDYNTGLLKLWIDGEVAKVQQEEQAMIFTSGNIGIGARISK